VPQSVALDDNLSKEQLLFDSSQAASVPIFSNSVFSRYRIQAPSNKIVDATKSHSNLVERLNIF